MESVATGLEVDLGPSIVASPAVLEQAQAQGRAEMERELAQYKALGSQGQRAAGAGATEVSVTDAVLKSARQTCTRKMNSMWYSTRVVKRWPWSSRGRLN